MSRGALVFYSVEAIGSYSIDCVDYLQLPCTEYDECWFYIFECWFSTGMRNDPRSALGRQIGPPRQKLQFAYASL